MAGKLMLTPFSRVLLSCLAAEVCCSSVRMASSAEQGNPFNHMKISSWDPLRHVVGRTLCPGCGRSRKFYCYSCYQLVGLEPSKVPRIKLPVKIDIIKHRQEVEGKSTSSHARILAPDDVTIYIYPNMPDLRDTSRVLLLYPMKTSETTTQCAARLKAAASSSGESGTGWNNIDCVVCIDSTWQQTTSIMKDERINSLHSVKLTDAKTYFWRPQRKTDTHLATIEAIYYFLREMDPLLTERVYDAQFDNLLYFYAYQYSLVQVAQTQRQLELKHSQSDGISTKPVVRS